MRSVRSPGALRVLVVDVENEPDLNQSGDYEATDGKDHDQD